MLEFKIILPPKLPRLGANFSKLDRAELLHDIEEEFIPLGVVLREATIQATPRGATSRLAASTTFSTHLIGDSVFLVLRQPARRAAPAGPYTGQLYQRYAIAGRRPGRAPFSNWLIPWVIQKWRPAKRWQARQWAFRLAQHIGRFGTQPHPYPAAVVQQNRQVIESTYRRIAARIRQRIRYNT